MIENGPGWVRIKHQDTGGEAEITQAAFDEPSSGGYVSYPERGWTIIEQHPGTETPVAVAAPPSGLVPALGADGGDD